MSPKLAAMPPVVASPSATRMSRVARALACSSAVTGRSRRPASSPSISRTAGAVDSAKTAARAAKLPGRRRKAKLDDAP